MKKLLVLGLLACGMVTMFASTSLPVEASVLKPKSGFTDEVGGTTNAVKEVNVIGANNGGQGQQDALINVIKGWVNWVLGIMALIALIYLMYGGFLMVTSAGNEDQYKKGFTILRHGAIGLALIGIAWFIVSIVFWLINLAGDATVGQSAGTGN